MDEVQRREANEVSANAPQARHRGFASGGGPNDASRTSIYTNVFDSQF